MQENLTRLLHALVFMESVQVSFQIMRLSAFACMTFLLRISSSKASCAKLLQTATPYWSGR